MQRPERSFRILARVSKTRSLLPVLGLRNIDVVSRVKNLRLFTLVHFEIIKIECSAPLNPGVVSEQRCGAVVAVRINRPMCEYDVRTFSVQKLSEVGVSRLIQLRIAIDLPCEYRPRIQYGAGFFALCRSDSGRLLH